MVNVVFGAHDLDMPLAGFTVEEIQYSLRNLLNVDMEADAYLDGHLVVDKDAVILKSGARLEFMHQKGRKGVGMVWRGDKAFMEYFGIDAGMLQQWLDERLPRINLPNGERRYIETTLDPWFERKCRMAGDDASRIEGFGIVVDLAGKEIIVDKKTFAVDDPVFLRILALLIEANGHPVSRTDLRKHRELELEGRLERTIGDLMKVVPSLEDRIKSSKRGYWIVEG